MPEPTLTSLLTRIEILERHVERLEQQAAGFVIEERAAVRNSENRITRLERTVDFEDLPGRVRKLEQAATITRRTSPSQTRAAEDDPDRATTVARCLYDTAV